MKFRVRFDPSLLSPAEAPVETEISIPAPTARTIARVAEIYPTSDELPENLLKFYIHFSAPMSRGESYQHIHLVDDKGEIVASPFLELEEELWNPQMTRFTLLFDPGRIKHGLVSQMQVGPALAAGRTYKLVVDAAWRDADGRPLVQSTTRTFRTSPAERRGPDPARWRVTAPKAASKTPLVVEFDKALDHAMLQRVLSVRDAGGRPVPGTVDISAHERRWSFSPQSSWHPGRYNLSVETILEDQAGNSIARPFEVDLNRESAAEPPGIVNVPVDIPK